MKYSRPLERICRKFTITICGLSGLALVGLALPGAAAGPFEVNIKTKFVEITRKAGDTNGLVFGSFRYDPSTNSGGGEQADGAAQRAITGILTDEQYRAVLRALEQRDGVDILTGPDVVTESGRQAQIQAVEVGGIVTGSGLRFGTGSNTVEDTPVGGAATPAFAPATSLAPAGPSVDVLATVSADGFGVNLALLPTITEFMGYETNSLVNPSSNTTNTRPMPHFRMRQLVGKANIWDRQTVVIGGVRPFQSEHSLEVSKDLIIFVTITLINPDGTLAHSDEEIAVAGSSNPAANGDKFSSEKMIGNFAPRTRRAQRRG